ncbi:MAG: DUF1573 domain-containing protein [Isosphaeraceae bacterium]
MAAFRLSCMALAFAVAGCSAAKDPDPDLSATFGDPIPGGGNVSSAQVHDLGVIFAQGQTLRHEFTLKNESKRPLRLIGAAALTPCCSSVGPLPGSIPPAGEVKVPVSFKPGYRSGLKAVLFTVETGEKERPVRTLALQARLVSAFEMQPLEGSTTSVALGQSGRQTFLLTARRKGNQGRSLPEKLSVSSPLEVAFRGKAATKSDADGLVEASREMIVTIPAEKQAGSRGGGVTFSWPDGQTETRPVSWEVRPRLRGSPSGLVLHRSAKPVQQTVLVISDGRPFRVEKVSSPILSGKAELPRQCAVRQVLSLRLDASRAPASRAVDIAIKTDHPDQPSVSLSVLVLPEAKEDGS